MAFRDTTKKRLRIKDLKAVRVVGVPNKTLNLRVLFFPVQTDSAKGPLAVNIRWFINAEYERLVILHNYLRQINTDTDTALNLLYHSSTVETASTPGAARGYCRHYPIKNTVRCSVRWRVSPLVFLTPRL